MKIPALLTLLLAAALSALPMSQARADSDVTFDVFYSSLGDQGDWYNTPEYGYVWQPTLAAQNDKWRPYSDGYWAQTDGGWTWVSYENFGWATYHYGRWIQLDDLGWVWVPGYQWGPGWVSWRTSDEYVGWAPLPPKAHHGGGGGGGDISINYNDVEPADEGYTSNVDADYDIGPSHYCFVPVHNFGAPVLVQVIVPPAQNITIIEHTTNVTNIVYNNGGGTVVVVNNGPDFAYLSHHVDHPIQHLILQQHNDIAYLHEHLKGGNPTLVKNGTLFVPTPYIEHRPINFNQVRPVTVKRDIREVHVEHGWRNSGADPTTQQRLRNQFQQQAHEHPSRPPGNPTANSTPFRNDDRREHNNGQPTPLPNNSQPFNRPDDDRRARQEAADRDRQAREAAAHNNGGQPPPGAERERDPRHQPSVATPTPPQNRDNHENPRQRPDARPTPTAAPRQQEQEQRQQAQDHAREQQAQQRQQEQEHAQEQRQQSQDRAREQQQERQRDQQQHQQERQAQEQQQQQHRQEQQTQERQRDQEHAQEQRQQSQDRAREQEKQAQQRQTEQRQTEQRQTEQRQPEQRQAEQRRPEQQQQQRTPPAKADDDKKKRPDQ